MSNPIETHLDVLQNIEFAIVNVYRSAPALIDLDVLAAMDALVRRYSLEEDGRSSSEPRLADRPAEVFAAVQEVCEWRLGRGRPRKLDEEPSAALPLSDLVKCLRRIQKSVRLWNQEGGRQGYLGFVSQYVQ